MLNAFAGSDPGAAVLALAITLVIRIYYGLHGSAIAWEHKGCTSVDELRASEQGWTIAGVLFGVLDILLTLVALSAAA